MTENKCLVCNSAQRKWIEEQHGNGKPLRDISKELEEQFSESISHVAIGNHMNKHMNSEADIMAELMQRVRNLEIWMGSALPAETFLTWFSKLARSRDPTPHTVSYRNSYMQTIPNPEAIHSESIAIISAISARMDEDEAGRDRAQKDVWAREKAERDRVAKIARDEQEAAQKKASDEAKRIEIEKMREEVVEFDKKSK